MSEQAKTPSESGERRTPGRRILYCHCAHARVVPAAVKSAVLEGLAESGVAFDAVPDLCELAAKHDPALVRLAGGAAEPNGTSKLDIVACYPRAVRWLFHAADAPLPEEGVRVHNMRVDEAQSVLNAVLDPEVVHSDATGSQEDAVAPEGGRSTEDAMPPAGATGTATQDHDDLREGAA